TRSARSPSHRSSPPAVTTATSSGRPRCAPPTASAVAIVASSRAWTDRVCSAPQGAPSSQVPVGLRRGRPLTLGEPPPTIADEGGTPGPDLTHEGGSGTPRTL